MFSACRNALALALVCIAVGSGARELRVCADPDNLPLSHENGGGFENRIARLVADEMHAKLSYAWLPLRRGFVRKTMDAGLCDVFIGVPKDFDRVTTTRSYYRSSYVFVDGPRARGIEAFDDARLRALRVGVQLVGNDLAATPAGHALAMNGYSDNVRGFTIYGETPASERMIAAVAAGELDVALVWGPQAGYFVRRSTQPLEIHVARLDPGIAGIPIEFDIAMGVRKGDLALRDELDAIIERRRSDIDAILMVYAVPRTDLRRAEVP